MKLADSFGAFHAIERRLKSTCIGLMQPTCSVSSDIFIFFSSLSKSIAPSCRRKACVNIINGCSCKQITCLKIILHAAALSSSDYICSSSQNCFRLFGHTFSMNVDFVYVGIAVEKNLEDNQLPTHQLRCTRLDANENT